MKTPSFSYMGGKSRLRKWLTSHFPKSGHTYIEPFAGRGNVFFYARQVLNFSHWHLNDINTSFFQALLAVKQNQLFDQFPAFVTKDSFQNWKVSTGPVAKVIEPRITFGGKGYSAGFNGTTGKHTPYNGKLYKNICEIAVELLEGVKITEWSWENALDYGEEDFVYLDPPYVTGKTPYPNIEHEKLIEVLNEAKFRWAVSGYTSELYDKKLKYKKVVWRERNAEIKGSNTGSYQAVNEHLWMNYT